MFRTYLIVPFVFALSGMAPAASGVESEPQGASTKEADALFRSGRLAEARHAYEVLERSDPKNADVALRLGELALFGNRFADAKRYLERVMALHPDDDKPKGLLAEAYYRQDKFDLAEPLLRQIGRTAVADKLASFKGVKPNEILGTVTKSRVKFVQTDPLPIVEVRINGGEGILLLIDTGGSELTLDPEYAESIGLKRFGSTMGTFAGGKKRSVGHARVDTVGLGDFTIRNVPVHLLPTRHLPFSVDGQRIDGVLGTVLFYHFLTTLDYPGEALVLRRRTKESLAEFDSSAKRTEGHVVPMWMAGSHWLMAPGEVNGRDRSLLHVDTGLAGGGFTCSEETIKKAGITLSDQSFEGMGGGGKVTVTPFTVDELSLGGAKRKDISGLFGAIPSTHDFQYGFRIGGIISHGFFRPFALTFDFDRMQIHLQPGS